ncbi:B1 bradykinin receptor [Salarias fasciatus]|uniref:B1 bradykinin receptor n=1 Tax=Salarias fasciatus TaxID=181472 RepID=UPI001176EA80|nr:B2 bradykinin receptor-like [Salarias fasciatus]
MEQMMQVTVATLLPENSSTSSPFGPSTAPVSAEWDLITTTILPPCIFILSLSGLLFNTFVLAVFLIHKDRLTVAEIYLSNLALADFLLLCGLPFWAMSLLNNFDWPYGDALCKLVNSIILINFYTSIYTLVMISIDRYLALVKTMTAGWLRRTLYAKVACFVLWILGLLLSVPAMIHRQTIFNEENELTYCILNYDHGSFSKLTHQILLNLVGFILPVLIIVFSSGNIIRSLAQRRENMGFQDINDTKATVLVYSVTALFLLCWGPFQIFTFLDTLCDIQVLDEELWSHTLDIGTQVSAYIAVLNSTLNPLLYVFSGQYFRRKVSAIYRRNRNQRRGSDMTIYQRSVVSTYINRTDQIKAVVLFNVKDQR